MRRDAGQFERFYDDQFSPVCRALQLAFGDDGLAEEAAQEAFTRAYVYWRRVARMDRPSGWVYVVAVRIAISRLRKRSGLTPIAVAATPDDAVIDRETLRAAIERLPARQRTAVVLRYFADLPLADVASGMGCTVGTVKSTLHAALHRLAVELRDDELEESRDA